MFDKLKFVFENINNWLKFAEAKHGILIAFSGMLLVNLNKLIPSSPIIMLISSSLIISIAISFSSFFPTLLKFKKLSGYRESNHEKEDNLIYFGDISKYDYLPFLEHVKNQWMNKSENEDISKIETQLIEQIVVNSKIANAKFNLFQYSLIFFGLAILFVFSSFAFALFSDWVKFVYLSCFLGGSVFGIILKNLIDRPK